MLFPEHPQRGLAVIFHSVEGHDSAAAELHRRGADLLLRNLVLRQERLHILLFFGSRFPTVIRASHLRRGISANRYHWWWIEGTKQARQRLDIGALDNRCGALLAALLLPQLVRKFADADLVENSFGFDLMHDCSVQSP